MCSGYVFVVCKCIHILISINLLYYYSANVATSKPLNEGLSQLKRKEALQQYVSLLLVRNFVTRKSSNSCSWISLDVAVFGRHLTISTICITQSMQYITNFINFYLSSNSRSWISLDMAVFRKHLNHFNHICITTHALE